MECYFRKYGELRGIGAAAVNFNRDFFRIEFIVIIMKQKKSHYKHYYNLK